MSIQKIVYVVLTLMLPCFMAAQLYTVQDFIDNQKIEKKMIIDNKITRIEVAHYYEIKDSKTEWKPVGKSIYYYDANGFLIKRSIIDFNFKTGDEVEVWSGKFVYTNGICDSVPTDKAMLRKAISPNDMYPTCYVYKGHQELKNGLAIITKSPKKQGGTKNKFVYTFKTD